MTRHGRHFVVVVVGMGLRRSRKQRYDARVHGHQNVKPIIVRSMRNNENKMNEKSRPTAMVAAKPQQNGRVIVRGRGKFKKRSLVETKIERSFDFEAKKIQTIASRYEQRQYLMA